ncbi:MAG: division/cell wall cluster transcriptional repressor MraZ [Pseudomonadota bacterium]|nr:division/cell wall cluster transcriptional repressor MraZ [Pseudomonadota bacterium]
MFRGVSACNVDAKGRFAMPTKYRAMIQDSIKNPCVITIDTDDDCLLLYPLDVWEDIERKLQSMPSLNPQVRRIQRILIGHAQECEMDSQGRFLLAPLLREHAGIHKKMVLVGQGKRFELWDETRWVNQRQQWLDENRQAKAAGENIAEPLTELSL